MSLMWGCCARISSIFSLCSEVGNIFFKASFKWVVSVADLGDGERPEFTRDVVGNRGTLGTRPETGFGSNCPLPSDCIRKGDIPKGRWLPLVRLYGVGVALEKKRIAFSMRGFDW